MNRQYLLFGIRLAIGIGILVVALRIIDFQSVLAAIRSLDPVVYLVALALAIVGGIVVPAIITSRILVVGNIRIGLWELVKINFAMRFYVLTLPHVITVGMRWHRYQKGHEGKGWQVAAMLVFERAAQLVAVVVLAFAFLLVSYDSLPESLHVLLPASAGLAVAGIVLILVFVSSRAYSTVQPLIAFVIRHTPRAVSARLSRFTEAVVNYQALGNRSVLFVLGWQAAWHLLLVLSAYVLCLGLDINIGFVDLGWMRSAALLVMILPITVGGLGVREVVFAVLLTLHGVEESVALALPVLMLSNQLAISFIGAALEAVRAFSGLRTNG